MLSIHLIPKHIVTLLSSLSLLGWVFATEAFPHNRPQPPLLALDHQEFDFIPPEDSGQPRTNRAGGRRDQMCSHSMPNPSLTLLLPPTNQGLTTAAHPTFLVYLPQTPATQAFVTLEDENNNYFYHTTFTLPENAGIVSFSIPEQAPPLEPNKYYKISLAMICGKVLDPSDPVVEGWIKRTELEAVPQLLPAAALDLGAWYASNGVWFEALNTLAALRRAEPDNPDVTTAWARLLQSVDLDFVENARLFDTLD